MGTGRCPILQVSNLKHHRLSTMSCCKEVLYLPNWIKQAIITVVGKVFTQQCVLAFYASCLFSPVIFSDFPSRGQTALHRCSKCGRHGGGTGTHHFIVTTERHTRMRRSDITQKCAFAWRLQRGSCISYIMNTMTYLHIHPEYRSNIETNVACRRAAGTHLDTKDTLSQKHVSDCGVDELTSGVTGRNHVAVLELHGLGTGRAKLTRDNYLTSLGTALHHKAQHTIACPAAQLTLDKSTLALTKASVK